MKSKKTIIRKRKSYFNIIGKEFICIFAKLGILRDIYANAKVKWEREYNRHIPKQISSFMMPKML